MKLYIILAVLLCAASVINSSAQARKVFPYQYKTDDLPNGLRVVTVPTDYPNLVALYIVVGAGSRNEVEAKKSGYAHFFEHLMFRGSENFPAGQFDEIMKKAGASSNAYTSDDRTVYHETFAKEDLDEVMRLEADRFQRLKFSEEQYKTEAGAVLGEYNKNSASPTFKMYEVMRETAFRTAHLQPHDDGLSRRHQGLSESIRIRVAVFQSLLPTGKHDDHRRRRRQTAGSSGNGQKILERLESGRL